MKKADLFKKAAVHLNFIKENDLLSNERKLEQGYGFITGICFVTNDKYFDEITEMWDLWQMAMHPAYKTSYTEFEKKYLNKKISHI